MPHMPQLIVNWFTHNQGKIRIILLLPVEWIDIFVARVLLNRGNPQAGFAVSRRDETIGDVLRTRQIPCLRSDKSTNFPSGIPPLRPGA